METEVIYITLKLAFITTLILLVVGIPISYWLFESKAKGKVFMEALISLPIVLPSTVIGFYMLLLFNPSYGIGHFFHYYFGIDLIFNFNGLVLGSVIYSLPFMMQALKTGFSQIPNQLILEAKILGKNKWAILFKVILPLMKQALLNGSVLTFTHVIGEFGIILMIGGNIPNETKVVSIAIFDEVERMNYSVAHQYAGALLLFSFIALVLIYKQQFSLFRKL